MFHVKHPTGLYSGIIESVRSVWRNFIPRQEIEEIVQMIG